MQTFPAHLLSIMIHGMPGTSMPAHTNRGSTGARPLLNAASQGSKRQRVCARVEQNKGKYILVGIFHSSRPVYLASARKPGAMSSLTTSIPLAVFSDTYKATHPLQYPDCNKMVAYGEFRCGYARDKADTRIVHYGMRHLIETYLLRRWTEDDLAQAQRFYTTHCTSGTPLPWPQDLFEKVVRERNGYFPIRVQALREGTCTHARVPAYQITAEGEFAPLCLFIETVLTHVWYPTTVATLSRRARDVIEEAFEHAADGGAQHPLVASRLHDFGMRGCCTGEQAIIGGCAHLLNFEGSDTMPAAFHAQFHLNGGRPVAASIPATVRFAPLCNVMNCLLTPSH
jgi:hypothetical protein